MLPISIRGHQKRPWSELHELLIDLTYERSNQWINFVNTEKSRDDFRCSAFTVTRQNIISKQIDTGYAFYSNRTFLPEWYTELQYIFEGKFYTAGTINNP